MKQIGTDDIVECIREIDGRLVVLDEELADHFDVPLAELRAIVCARRMPRTWS